jgi:hypothetical protein
VGPKRSEIKGDESYLFINLIVTPVITMMMVMFLLVVFQQGKKDVSKSQRGKRSWFGNDQLPDFVFRLHCLGLQERGAFLPAWACSQKPLEASSVLGLHILPSRLSRERAQRRGG